MVLRGVIVVEELPLQQVILFEKPYLLNIIQEWILVEYHLRDIPQPIQGDLVETGAHVRGPAKTVTLLEEACHFQYLLLLQYLHLHAQNQSVIFSGVSIPINSVPYDLLILEIALSLPKVLLPFLGPNGFNNSVIEARLLLLNHQRLNLKEIHNILLQNLILIDPVIVQVYRQNIGCVEDI